MTRDLHVIEDDLAAETWIDSIICDLERYLAKWAAFGEFLTNRRGDTA